MMMMLDRFNGAFILIPFFIALIFICVSSYFLSVAAVGIKQKTKLNSGFIGIFLVSFTTSLPEIITAFFSPVLSDAKYATYNMLGSNTLTQTALVLTFLLFIKRDYLKSFSSSNKKINLALVVTSAWFILPFFLPSLRITLFGMSLQLLVFMFFYLILLLKTGFINEENDKQEKTHLTKNQIIFNFILFAIILTLSSIILIKIVDKIALPLDKGGLGIGQSLAGTLFLSIATTLPEILTFVWLLKMNTHNIAINSVLGSDLFNLFILALADLFVIKGGAIEFVYSSIEIGIIQRKFFFTLPAYLLMFLFASLKLKNKKWLNLILTIFTVTLFLWSFKIF